MRSDAPESRGDAGGIPSRRSSYADMMWERQYVDGTFDASLEGPRAIKVVTGEYWERSR